MLDIFIKGWNVFSKKVYFLYLFIIALLYTGFTIIFSGYIQSLIEEISTRMVDIKAIHFFAYFSKELIIIGLLWFIGLIFINYLSYIAGKSETDKKLKNTNNGLWKTIIYSIILSIVFLVLIVIGSILITYLGVSILLTIILTILLILLGLFLITIALTFTFGIFYMGINEKTIKESLFDSWNLVRKRFWLIVGFIIIMIIILGIIYLIVDELYYIIFGYNELASMILRYILLILFIMYSTNTTAIFVKKYS